VSDTFRKLYVFLSSERAVHTESQFSRHNLTARPRSTNAPRFANALTALFPVCSGLASAAIQVRELAENFSST